MNITIFRPEDLKKAGGFRVTNQSYILNEEEFKNYVKKNNLQLRKGYIDNIGFISNGELFKCDHQGLMIGVTTIINEINEGD